MSVISSRCSEDTSASEETAAVFSSPSFTPTFKDKPLPPIETTDDTSALLSQSPTAWHTPQSESPLQESSLLNLYRASENCTEIDQSQESRGWGVCDGRPQQTRQDSYSDSPISYSSSSQIDSTRLSCSTLTSSGTRTCSESSAAASPQGYGFALGSPMRDSRIQEQGDRSTQSFNASTIGLGLPDDLVSTTAIVPTSGPFSHHRRPSWTLQNIMVKSAAPAQVDVDDEEELPAMPLSFPARVTSRSRSNSYASIKNRQGKLHTPFEEALAFPIPSPVQSSSGHSIASTTADSSFSHVSPRTSSLKKTKSRPKLLSKASEPILTTLRPPYSSVANRAKAGSVSESQRGGNGWTQSQDREGATGSSSTMRDLHDYLAYTAGDAIEQLPTSPVKTKAMAEDGILIFTRDITLDELERRAGLDTTHLLLSACQDSSLTDFLNRVLPIVGPSLLVLDVSKTSLKQLPDSLIHCTSLEELNISNIAFERPWTGHALSRLSTLRVLLADSCQFVIVPAEIAQLQMLKTLSLQNNSLSHLPSWLYRLNLLHRLCLDGNPFQGQWQQVCEAFTPQSVEISPIAVRPLMERAPDSAPSRMDTSDDAPLEEFEEMADDLPVTAPIMQPVKTKEDKIMRPLMRRMLSGSSDAPLEDCALGLGGGSSFRPRQPSQAQENGEKKWGSLMRKLGRKPSNPQMPLSRTSSTSSSPVKSRSNSLQKQQVMKVSQPLTPVGWKEISGDSSWSSSKSKRDSYLAISQDGPEANHRRKLQALMQYLKDLDDLSALRLGPAGTVSAMETSMAPRYTSPTKELASMDRSGSETSRESMHSTSSSSSASQVTSEQSDRSNASQVTKDDAQRRIRILQEIVATEETYIRGLQELIDIYVVPSAATDASSGQAIVPVAERRSVFANIEGIFHFHQSAFLPALRLATQSIIDASAEDVERQRADAEGYNAMSASMTEQVASVFIKHAAYFRMYTAYVNNVEAAHKRVSQWKLPKMENGSNLGNATVAATDGSPSVNLSPKERKRIKVYLQRAKLDPRHSQLSLETYLHLPVQRIPRYRLLFEDLVRSCPTHRLRDPTAITRALDSICSVATQMNESKRQCENDRKLLEWQARIKGHFASPLLQPHRRLIKDGDLILKRVVMRTTAFHMAKSQWLDEECQQSTQCDGAVSDTDLGLVQIDCLDQQSMNKTVHVLLCNDITVVVVKDDPFAGHNSPVDLFAVLRIQGSVELVSPTTLRVVDPKHILYFSASSPTQAQDWKAAMMSVHQEPRTIKAPTAL